MAKAPKSITFKTELVQATTGSGWHFLLVEKKIEQKFGFEGKFKRVVCSINGGEGFQCALMPWCDRFYIIVNKSKRDAVGIIAGDMVHVELVKDESEYGLPMPEEFLEVLRQDPEGDRLFHSLSKGKQRSLIHLIITVKNVDKRIHIALVCLDHLKENGGNVVGSKLHEELKRPEL